MNILVIVFLSVLFFSIITFPLFWVLEGKACRIFYIIWASVIILGWLALIVLTIIIEHDIVLAALIFIVGSFF